MSSIQHPHDSSQENKRYCECGCGREVRPKRRFISGHNFPMRNPEYVAKHNDTLSANATKKRQAYHQQWHEENRQRRNEASRKRRYQAKVDALTHYGNGKCECLMCGFDNIVALTLDHINDDGYKDKRSGHELYSWLRTRDYPSGFQTLCMNCQYIKRDANGNHNRKDT